MTKEQEEGIAALRADIEKEMELRDQALAKIGHVTRRGAIGAIAAFAAGVGALAKPELSHELPPDADGYLADDSDDIS